MAESGRLDLENIAQYCISHGIRDPAIIARRMVVKGEDMEMPVTMDQAVAAARKAVGATAAAAGTWRDEDHPRGQPQNSGQFVKKGEEDMARNKDHPEREPPYVQKYLEKKREETGEERFERAQSEKKAAKMKTYEDHGLATGAITKGSTSVTEKEVFEFNDIMIKMLNQAVDMGRMDKEHTMFPSIYNHDPRPAKTILRSKNTIRRLMNWSKSDDPETWKWIPPVNMKHPTERSYLGSDDQNLSFDDDLYKEQVGITTMSPGMYLFYTLGFGDLDKLQKSKRGSKASEENIKRLTDMFKNNEPMDSVYLLLDRNNRVIQQEGNHRAFAAELAGITQMPVYIYKHAALTDDEFEKLGAGIYSWIKPMRDNDYGAVAAAGSTIAEKYMGRAGAAVFRLKMALSNFPQ